MKTLFVLAAQPKEVLDAGADAAETLTKTVLGSLVVLLAIAVGLLVWILIRAKNHHLEDKDKMATVLKDGALEQKRLAYESEKLIGSVISSVGDLSRSVDALRVDSCTKIDALKVAVDGTSKRVDAMALSSRDVDQKKYLAAKGGV